MVEYLEDGHIAVFNGNKYRLDKKTGYFLKSSKPRSRLHRDVWVFFNGDIPTGYHVHHKDENKKNNEPDNLMILLGREHSVHHMSDLSEERLSRMRENLLTKAVPKAVQWHKTKEGQAWHSEHAKKSIANMKERTYSCQQCGKQFSAKPIGQHKFCSNSCKSAFRRKSGTDNTTKRCICCGGEFIGNKYASSKYCSDQCRSEFRKGKKYQAALPG